jgi:uncharacterized membrane protein
LGRILRTFLAGVLALLPIAVTVFVVGWVASLVASYAGPGSFIGHLIIALGALFGLDIKASSTAAYLLGLAIILGVIFLLGLVVESGLRSFVLNSLDWLMTRIPLVSNVYDLTKRFVAMMDRSGGEDNLKTMQPVWCFFGGEGGAAVLGLMPSPEPRQALLSRPARAFGAGADRRRAHLRALGVGEARGRRRGAADERLRLDGRHAAAVETARDTESDRSRRARQTAGEAKTAEGAQIHMTSPLR